MSTQRFSICWIKICSSTLALCLRKLQRVHLFTVSEEKPLRLARHNLPDAAVNLRITQLWLTSPVGWVRTPNLSVIPETLKLVSEAILHYEQISGVLNFKRRNFEFRLLLLDHHLGRHHSNRQKKNKNHWASVFRRRNRRCNMSKTTLSTTLWVLVTPYEFLYQV